MPAPTGQQIADAYRTTRQRIHRLRTAHKLTIEEITDPETVLHVLLEKGRACPLRTRLTDPETRAAIRQELDLSAIRGAVPDTLAKITSIQ